jgi:hypothetical protein
MASKIVPLGIKKNHPGLSKLMIVTLVEAYVHQTQGIPFGPADIKGGSFSSLVNRGLIVSKTIVTKNQKQLVWQITPEAIEMLKEMGISEPALYRRS